MPDRAHVSDKPKAITQDERVQADAAFLRTQAGPLDAATRFLSETLAEEMGRILASARDYERQLRQAIAESCLLSRDQAAVHLNASVSQVDRWADTGALEVVMLDRRPRFALAELNRFIAVHAQKKKRRAKRPRGQKKD